MNNKKAGFFKSFGTFFLGVIAFLSFRWALYEPYVIPSGSMIPSLLIFDHIIVSKFSYGLRVPFTQSWVFGPKVPERGEVVVFQSVEEDIVMIKRVVGLPGDDVNITNQGELLINNQKVEVEPVSAAEVQKIYPVKIECEDCDRFVIEKLGAVEHLAQYSNNVGYSNENHFKVPEGHLFMMGDNRDRSRDSRYWGFLPLTNLLGKARWIWLSCDKAASQTPVLCNPAYIRWQRMFSKIQ